MAKLEKFIGGGFEQLKEYIKTELPKESSTFSIEEEFEGTSNGRRYWVVACERYAYLGNNRASLNITLLEEEGGNHVMATGTGGSSAMFIKFNTWSEANFLETLSTVLDRYCGVG